MNALTELSKGLRPFLISTVKTFTENAPISSNVVFSILLFIGEKIAEMEFTCPCGADCRVHFLVLLFIIPGLIGFVVATAIEISGSYACYCDYLKKLCVCLFPPVVWLTLLFLDGQYYTCINTDWPGQYVSVNHNVLEKWCEPNNRTLYQERLKESYGWYACSQLYGLYLLGILAILAFVIIKVESQPSNSGGTSSTPEGYVTVNPQSPSTSGGNNSPTDTTAV